MDNIIKMSMSSKLDEFLGMLNEYPNKIGYSSSYKEYDESFEIKLIVPGYSKDDLTIKIADDILNISSTDEKIKSNYRLNVNDVLVDSISAECKHGILYINIPKNKPKIKEHSIKIK